MRIVVLQLYHTLYSCRHIHILYNKQHFLHNHHLVTWQHHESPFIQNTCLVSPVLPLICNYVPWFWVSPAIFSLTVHNTMPCYFWYIYHCDYLSHWPLASSTLPLIAATNPPKLRCSDQGKSKSFYSNHVILVSHTTIVSKHVCYFVLWASSDLAQLPSMSTTFTLGVYFCAIYKYPSPPFPHYMVHLGLGKEKHHCSLTK